MSRGKRLGNLARFHSYSKCKEYSNGNYEDLGEDYALVESTRRRRERNALMRIRPELSRKYRRF